MLFDTSPGGLYLPAWMDVIGKLMTLRADTYDSEIFAKEDLDKTFEAVIMAPANFKKKENTGKELLALAHELEVPCAVFTSSSSIVLTTRDLLIPRNRAEQAARQLSRWLIGLEVKRT